MEKSYKVLIIDDSEEILKTYKKFFKKKNYIVSTASNGLDGLKILQTDPCEYDLVITDIVMPNISGVGIISIVKKKFPNIRIIAITGWGEHPEMLASEAEADLVLDKPIDLSELEKLIINLMESKKKYSNTI